MNEMMAAAIGNFQFLRPWWLFALLPVLLLVIWLWKQKHQARQWNQLIAPELLPFLVDGESGSIRRWHLVVLLAAWTLAVLALAGPVWEQRPLPVQKNDDALVLVMDLSPSMMTEDVKPSRLIRARLKIADILRERRDGLTALVVYAGDAHVVTPLTDDTATINSLLGALQPDVMPLPGSNTESAIETAIQLLRDSGNAQGHLLLITDGVASSAFDTIRQQLQATNYSLSVLGVGGESPAPIPSGRGSFVRDNQNNIVTTRLNTSELSRLASQNNGQFSVLTSDNRDINRVLDNKATANDEHSALDAEFDGWYERGYWLVFLLLPLVLYCFRRGVVLVIFCVPAASLLYAPESQAFGWSDLWQTKDQQAQQELQQGDAETAAETFANPDWKASAQYRAGQYEAAAEGFANSDTASAHFNRGNALAKAGKLDESIKAYDEALKRQPEFPEAQANRDLVQQLLDQQQNQDQDQQNQDQNDDQQQDGENENSSDGNSDDQSQDQQDQQQDQQDSEQNQDSNNEQQSSDASNDPQDEQSDNAESDQQQSSSANSEEEEHPAQPEEGEAETDAENREMEATAGEESDLTDEQKQALEQWLRRVPDDPSGLLRNKFRYQYHQQQQQRLRNNWQVPGSADEERW